VGEIRDRDEKLASRSQHPKELGECPGLFLERQVLENVETHSAVERALGIRQGSYRTAADTFGRIVRVDAFDCKASCELFDEDALATSGIEYTCGLRRRVQPLPNGFELGDVGGVIVPVRIRGPVVIAARGVFAPGRTGGLTVMIGVILQ